jgi:hypothetical protein
VIRCQGNAWRANIAAAWGVEPDFLPLASHPARRCNLAASGDDRQQDGDCTAEAVSSLLPHREGAMAFAGTALAGPEIRIPRVAMPKLRWPRFSRRDRALMMICVMISPSFLADPIGYGVKRLFLTADQIAEKQMPDDTILQRVRMFHVACTDTDMPVADQRHWADFAAQQGWPRYPEAGAGCFKPDRVLFGVVGLKAFNVACPAMVFSAPDQRRWVAYAADHGWTDYPQAGAGCVDP